MSTRVWRAAAASVAALAVLSSCSFGPPPPDESGEPPNLPSPSTDPEAANPSVVASVIAGDLEVPWGLAFLPDGSALVTERESARLLQITMPDDPMAAPSVDEVQVIEEVVPDGEGGLLGVAVSPEYDTDETVYIFYTAEDDNRIAALKLGEAPEPILTGIPKSSIHNGGQLSFGPDGMLYATTGDASDPDAAQDEDSLAGKILRMTPEGEAPDDNPFDDSVVYTLGHRNSQGLAWGPEEQLYATEFGADSADELNRIEAGKNYGWPIVEGHGGGDDLTDPLLTWEPAEASCAGASFADSILVMACLRGERLWEVEFAANGTVVGEPTASLIGELGRLRAVAEAPDGTLWISTSNVEKEQARDGDDQIIRIVAGGSIEGQT
ncbi:glucose/arabinose dehydrogenase [Stackebrandtia endophytica]|uniref:Glucose/arabinose dehydrogenase n=1 Tax=Stackebrandtia endophytica TaxID=1496996 RepID=A0A543ARP6_9ACTN|nr:PQQ-dependent sugar dehydrogenase [Stackebrandtia endophytica]TQL75261.1 glucose/arabinose dehydrogenase [Stackebrandtia endophytica]